ncbi:hypothetical protein BV25DRAFT_1830101 [Artomyces pyxidatus]|uniref:Uncharacterized protein n=1 Tax=Artomyces pyxidatus TaxID=48021 RepID=A0ACB8SQF2_9AGAM|nr:hypothetical protein BV25DRAFT_1830101 [Artomyces pyxidatus]
MSSQLPFTFGNSSLSRNPSVVSSTPVPAVSPSFTVVPNQTPSSAIDSPARSRNGTASASGHGSGHTTKNINVKGPAYTLNERFFFKNESVLLLTEDLVEYRLNRHFFRYSCLLSGDKQDDPTTSEIHLKGVSSQELDAFLSIIYPSNYKTPELVTVDEWSSVLRLATRWEFTSIGNLAIQHLSRIASDVDCIVLSRTYAALKPWAVPAYVELCRRETPLTEEEAERLSGRDVLFFYNMRETMRNTTSAISKDETTRRVEDWLRRYEQSPGLVARKT